jgi:tRNA(Arg) A34 adenosine deaminase TadA
MTELDHARYMARAVALAARVPDRPFAAVVVDRDTGAVVAEGWNESANNPTRHGEMVALNNWVASAGRGDPSRLVLYSTAEPCPMCQGAIVWTGVGAVVFGTSIRFLLETGWEQIDIPAAEVVRRTPGCRCSVTGGVMVAECDELFLAASRVAPGR